MERIVKKINLSYYLIYTLTILSTIVGYIITQTRETTIDVKSPLSITLSSIVIIYIIISIPAALAIFNRNIKKYISIEEDYKKMEKYTSAATWRILAVGFGLVLSVVVFYIIRTESMIFCAGISALALIICKPTPGKINSDLKLDEPKEDEEEENDIQP
jgi:DMSO reductase anchor subunit